MKNKAVVQFLNNPSGPGVKQGNWWMDRNSIRTKLFFKNKLIAAYRPTANVVKLSGWSIVDCGFTYPTFHAITNVQNLIRNTYKTEMIKVSG